MFWIQIFMFREKKKEKKKGISMLTTLKLECHTFLLKKETKISLSPIALLTPDCRNIIVVCFRGGMIWDSGRRKRKGRENLTIYLASTPKLRLWVEEK